MERPSDFPDPDHPLLEAARYNDAAAEEHGLEDAITNLGIDMDALRHTAYQRATRIVLMRNPARLVTLQEHMKAGGEAIALPFTPDEEAEIVMLTSLYLDAIALGWKGKELADAASSS